MKDWERRGGRWYYRGGDWEYQIVRARGVWRLYKKHINDESWDVLNDYDDLQTAKEAI